jgi:NADPH2 dehydrogenase
MSRFTPIGSIRSIDAFEDYLESLELSIPMEKQVVCGAGSSLAQPIRLKKLTIGNRFAIHPMEGWDGAADGKPTENTLRRWRRFGSSGAKLIWGGEAVAVTHDGRANPNQLMAGPGTRDGLALLREALVEEHRRTIGSVDGLVVGLQLTHSGRFSRPNSSTRLEPQILYHHPLLDSRLGIESGYPVLTDGEIRRIIEAFHKAARMAYGIGFDFVDIKHCHGYLGHEFLSAYTREGDYGGSLQNRTRFLREIVEGIRASAPSLEIGVRLSAFDTIPFRPDGQPGSKPGTGVPEQFQDHAPYRWGFGVSSANPLEPDLSETETFISLLIDEGIELLNVSAGSPYYNPHIQRPALYPPSDGYLPPEDPLKGVERQMLAVRVLKQRFPNVAMVGSAYSYLQDFLPNVAQAAVRGGWVDVVGLGRMALAYPELPQDLLEGRPLRHKKICRTFSDCTTAPRKGLPSGCYPLDEHYKRSEAAGKLKEAKRAK